MWELINSIVPLNYMIAFCNMELVMGLRDIELNGNSSRWNGGKQGIQVNDEIELPTSLETAPPSLEIQSFDSLPADVLVNHILPFVGNNQYRFVAGVCKTFQTSYVSLYQKKTSYCYVSSKEQAQICLNECPMFKRRNLCELAALHGNLVVLQYLRSMGCSWDWRTCANAAENGHLDVLIWARANHCRWGWSTCSNAAKNGHLDLLKWARMNGVSTAIRILRCVYTIVVASIGRVVCSVIS
jgi:hypothetical protein